MISPKNRMTLIPVAAGVVLAAVALYLLLARQQLHMHPSRPRPGTFPRMTRGTRSPLR